MGEIPKNLLLAAKAAGSDLAESFFSELARAAGSEGKAAEIFAELFDDVASLLMGVSVASQLFDGLTSADAFRLLEEAGEIDPEEAIDEAESEKEDDSLSFSQSAAREAAFSLMQSELVPQELDGEFSEEPDAEDDTNDQHDENEGQDSADEEGCQAEDEYDDPFSLSYRIEPEPLSKKDPRPEWRNSSFRKDGHLEEIKAVLSKELSRRVDTLGADLSGVAEFNRVMVTVSTLLGRAVEATELQKMMNNSFTFKRWMHKQFKRRD